MGISGDFNPEYESALSMSGLADYESVMSCEAGEVLAESRTTSTVLVTLADGRRICLKRYRYPKPILRYAVRRSRAEAEWGNLAILREIGLKTANPVGWGEKRGNKLLKGCFIMTAYLAGFTDLAVYSRGNFPAPGDGDPGVRRRIATALAETAKKMHDARFINRGFLFRNLLFDPEAREAEFHLIDSPKGYRTTSAHRLRKGRVEDLAAIYTDFSRHFTEDNWDTFVRTYFGGGALSPRELAFLDDVMGKAYGVEKDRAGRNAAHDVGPAGAGDDG